MLKFRLAWVSFEVAWWVVATVAVGIGLAFWRSEALLVPLAYFSLFLHEMGHATVTRAIFGVASTVRFDGVIHGHTSARLPRPATRGERRVYAATGPLVGMCFGAWLLVAALTGGWGRVFAAGGGAIVLLHAASLLPRAGSDGAAIWG